MRRKVRPADAGLAVFVALLASSLTARAQSAAVLVVRPDAPSAAAAETLSRLHGELLSVGLEVEVTARPARAASDSTSARSWLEGVAAERTLDAVLDIVDGGPTAAVDIWIFSKEPRRSQVSRVVADANDQNANERLAIRAVDVLRSILIKGRLGGEAREDVATATPTAVARPDTSPASPSPPGPRLALELGAAMTSSFDGAAVAISPLLRVDWAAGSWLALQAELAGLGSRPQVGTEAGSARLSQQYALVGLCTCVPSSRRLRATFALSAGALHASAEGHAVAPAQAHSVEQWSFLLQASLGARLLAFQRYDLSVAAQAQLAEPYVAVYVVNSAVARVGRPTLVLTFTLGGWR